MANLVQRKMGWKKVKEALYSFLRVPEVPDNTEKKRKENPGRSRKIVTQRSPR